MWRWKDLFSRAVEPAPTASQTLPTLAQETTRTKDGAAQLPSASTDPPAPASSIDEIVRIEEVVNAEFFVSDLFCRRFRSDPPNYPRHYVAFYRPGRTQFVPVGYIHYTSFEDSYLCGGMVIDDRLYRRIYGPHRLLIRRAGGIAEKMLQDTFLRLRDAPAIWAYVGDKQSDKVCMRAGFRHTHHPHVMVVWNKPFSEAERQTRLERVIAIGPF